MTDDKGTGPTGWEGADRWFAGESEEKGTGPTGWEGAERWFARPSDADQDQVTSVQPGAPDAARGRDSLPPADATEGDEGTPSCSRCGSPLADEQTYCLVCGEPTSTAPRLARSLRSPALIGGALALLGIGAAALALILLSDDSGDAAAAGTSATTAATMPPAGLPTAPSAETAPLPTDTTVLPTVTAPEPVPEPIPEPVPEPEPEPESSELDWPIGEVAWTAMLSSVRSEPDAIAARDRLRARGTEAGVLFSSDHPGMAPGFYVVFSGMFDDRAQAVSQANRLDGEFPDAYAREIS